MLRAGKGYLGWMTMAGFLMALRISGEITTPTTPAPSGNNNSSGVQPTQVQRVKVFDDRVFELSTDKAPPSTTKSTQTGTERYLADEPDYNTGQRNEWVERCSKEDTQKAFSECFQREKSRNKQQMREKASAIEKGDLRSPWQERENRGNGLPKE